MTEAIIIRIPGHLDSAVGLLAPSHGKDRRASRRNWAVRLQEWGFRDAIYLYHFSVHFVSSTGTVTGEETVAGRDIGSYMESMETIRHE